MGKASKFDLEDMVRGDRWRGIAQIGPLLINAAPPLVSVVSARMHFRKAPGAPIKAHSIDNTSGGITILNAAAWIFTIPPQDLPLTAGVWHYDFETTDSTGAVRTYLKGTLTLEQDTTI